MSRQITTADDIKQLGTILTVWAHPDDESYTCAGIMTVAVQNGQTVACVTATKGELGVQDESRWPAAQLGEIRTEELAAALKILGITEHHWLTYHDGDCKNVPAAEAVLQIKRFIEHYQPDTILTFGPEGLTGHDDHCTVSRWVSAATKGTQIAVYHAVQLATEYEKMKKADDQFDIFFNIDEPPLKQSAACAICFYCPEAVIQRKCEALKAMPSQTEGMFKQFGTEGMHEMLSYEAFVRAEQ